MILPKKNMVKACFDRVKEGETAELQYSLCKMYIQYVYGVVLKYVTPKKSIESGPIVQILAADSLCCSQKMAGSPDVRSLGRR